jgi:RHS repeat-associated protein
VLRIDADMATTWTWGNSPDSRNVGGLVSLEAGGLKETYVYDPLARLSSKTATASGKSYVSRYYYDATTGLPERYSYPTLTGETQFAVRYQRDRGQVIRVSDAYGTGGTFWQALAWSPRGQATEELLGNGVKISSEYDAVTGLLKRRTAGASGAAGLQDLSFDWDANGNLIERRDAVRNLHETYRYDSRDRLDDVRSNGAMSLDLDYDEVGNITYKSDIGQYRYDTVRPHAAVAAGSNAYSYDNTGAVVQANGTSLQWASYNLPTRISHQNGNSSTFSYGINRERYRQVAVESGVTTDTLYLDGGLYERLSRGSSTTQRHYLAAGGRLLGVRVQAAGSTPVLSYFLTDHLGGVDALVASAGSLTARASYQPFGARRGGAGLGVAPTAPEWQAIQATTSRGYTAHEHLDNLGLIHMNGRVYDPNLGRFLSPDPFVASLLDPQGLNRYSYVGNNPLSAIDPSGFALEGLKEAWNDLVRIMIDGARPSPLGVNFNFSPNGGVQGPDARGSFTGPAGMGGPFSFGGTAAVGAFAAWNIEAGWHLPHSPPPSAGAVAAMRSGSSSGPRVSSDATSTTAVSRLPDALHIALDGISASPIPVASQAAGVTSGLWYAMDGDWLNAGLSIAGTVPVVGTVADAARTARNSSQLTRYLKKVEALDVGTPINGAVFYSGPGNRALAEEFARGNGRYTLEMTPGGKWLDDQALFGPNSPMSVDDAIRVWSRLSQRFSQQASGVAVGFVSRSRSGSVFNSVEYPELLANPRITNVLTGGQ